MDFGEIVAATAVGATVPVVVARALDRRARRKEAAKLAQTGYGRYMEHVLSDLDSAAGKLADKLAAKGDD